MAPSRLGDVLRRALPWEVSARVVLLQGGERRVTGHWKDGRMTLYSLSRPWAAWKRSVAKSRYWVILGSLMGIVSGSGDFGQLVQVLANGRVSRSQPTVPAANDVSVRSMNADPLRRGTF